MGDDTRTPIDLATLVAALQTLFEAREQQLASLAQRPDLPPVVKKEIRATLKAVRQEKAQWEGRHGVPA